MSLYPEVLECRIGLADVPLGDAAGHEGLGSIGIPVLRPSSEGKGGNEAEREEGTVRHRPAISRRLGYAASIVALGLATACTDVTIPGETSLSTSELLFLPLEAQAPAPPATSFYVANTRTVVRRVLHPDAFNSLYVEIRFPAGALEALNGTPLGPTDSVLVTVEPTAGAFGLTLRPSGLDFASGGAPTVTFSFAAYGDFSVADGSATYASRLEYAEALALWEDAGVERWDRVSGSGFTGSDAVSGRLSVPGTYRVAAPR